MSTSTVRILGIDPGFDRLGICILDKNGEKESLLYSTCLITSKKDSFEDRIISLGVSLEKILKEYKPQELAIEKLFLTKNQITAINVAQVRGVCLYISRLHKLSIYEYSPPEIKLAVTGYGKATKDDIANIVPKILKNPKIKGLLDDEMDAIAIALTHSSHRKLNMFK